MSDKNLVEDIDAEIARRLFLLMGDIRELIEAVAADFELTKAQAIVLRLLREPRAMGDIADKLSCDPSNITGLVDRLEARELVVRVSDPEDRRVRRIELSTEGRLVQSAIEAEVSRRVRDLITLNEDERILFHELLSQITG